MINLERGLIICECGHGDNFHGYAGCHFVGDHKVICSCENTRENLLRAEINALRKKLVIAVRTINNLAYKYQYDTIGTICRNALEEIEKVGNENATD